MSDYIRRTKKYYADHASNYSTLIAPWRMQLITKYNTKTKVVLDLGCGTGNYLIRLPNDKVYGIDISKESIDVLKKRSEYRKIKNKKTVIVGNALHMPFKEGTFDLIFSFSTMYYIKEFKEALTEINRVMRPGGIAILEFGNKYSINSLWDKMLFDVPQFHFSEHEIRTVFSDLDLRILKIYYRQPIPNIKNRFDKDFVTNPVLKKISFKLIFVVQKSKKIKE